MNNNKSPFFGIALAVFTLLMIGCNGNENTLDAPVELPRLPPVKLVAPLNMEHYVIGADIEVKIDFSASDEVESIALYVYDTLYQDKLELENQSIIIQTTNAKVGKTSIYIAYTKKDGKEHRDTREIVLFSDVKPGYKTAKVMGTTPHLTASFTQGLEFYNGNLYEGTGQYNQSILAEVDLNSGVHKRTVRMDANFFGEGITILNDTIYQLTWQSQTCVLYDMAFNEIGRLSYEGEGWGLCNDGQSIIMSNGSDKIVWRNPRTFEIEKYIYAFTPTESLVNLNELELIDNKLYVNIWQDDKIVELDPLTGKVLNFIDCKSIIGDGMVIGADVLNGIAHNTRSGKTYLTGKRWSKMYEVIFE